MVGMAQTRVKDVVTEDHRTAAVFEKYAIDFCCNGGQTIGEACAGRGIDPAALLQELDHVRKGGARAYSPEMWPLDVLIDHIVKVHHAYVARMIPVLEAHVAKVLSVHGDHHPELREIAPHVGNVIAELSAHMRKEEGMLFPWIREYVRAERAGGPVTPPPFGSVRNPIRMMESEHQSAGNALFEVRRLSGGYIAPEDACTTYRVTYRELEEFELDLHQHVHLENNILFPKAIALEERLFSR